MQDCPVTCKNFIKLCKCAGCLGPVPMPEPLICPALPALRRAKYYNNCIFHNVQQGFLVQTGDPSGKGKGGTSIYG